MVLMYADFAATAAMTAEQRADVFARHEALHRDLADTGELLNGAGLNAPEDTTTLRWRGDVDADADAEAHAEAGAGAEAGPFVESREQLTAYYVVECESAERAREIASRVVDFHVVAVEVRPVHDWFGMGEPPASA
jgi:hypothetical protein